MAWVTPTSRSDGYVVPASEWNQNTVDNPVALRAGGIAIASQAANDVFYASSSTQMARLAAGTAGQVLQTNGSGSAPSWATPASARNLTGGRLSLTTAVPVTSADVTAATTLYYALYGGNQIGLYDGSANWGVSTIAQLSVAVPATTNQMYDAFVDYNDGTPVLALTAWTNDTTRATALTTQDGVLVKTGDTQQRFVGCMRTTGVSGETEDSFNKRFVWNYYHQKPRPLRGPLEATNSWTYSTATWRQMNGAATNQFEFIIGVAEVPLYAQVVGIALHDTAATPTFIGIGVDSTSAPTASQFGKAEYIDNTHIAQLRADLYTMPAIGYHYVAALERATASGVTTWYGDNGDATLYQAGIHGLVNG